MSALDALLRGDKQRTELKSGAGESMQLEHQASELSRYRIKRGDTLSELSKKFHVSTETIATANEVVNPDVIIEGEEFVIPAEGL